jgi:hypothetical protein
MALERRCGGQVMRVDPITPDGRYDKAEILRDATIINTGPCAATAGAGPAACPSHGRGREPCGSALSCPPPAKRKARRLLADPTSNGIALRLLPLNGR